MWHLLHSARAEVQVHQQVGQLSGGRVHAERVLQSALSLPPQLLRLPAAPRPPQLVERQIACSMPLSS